MRRFIAVIMLALFSYSIFMSILYYKKSKEVYALKKFSKNQLLIQNKYMKITYKLLGTIEDIKKDTNNVFDPSYTNVIKEVFVVWEEIDSINNKYGLNDIKNK